MAVIVDFKRADEPRHLYWKGDHSVFVTLCDDGNVVYNGRVMTLAEATSLILRTKGVPPTFFWE